MICRSLTAMLLIVVLIIILAVVMAVLLIIGLRATSLLSTALMATALAAHSVVLLAAAGVRRIASLTGTSAVSASLIVVVGRVIATATIVGCLLLTIGTAK